MPRRPSLDDLVADLRADVASGAAEVCASAAAVFVEGAERARASTPEGLAGELADLAARVLDAQPAMAPLVALAREVLEAVAAEDDPEAARRAAADAARAFRRALGPRSERASARAAELLPRGGSVATISFSSTVRAALLARAEAEAAPVVCFESRPMREGRTLATELAERGVPVTFAVDAAAASLVPSCGAVLLGADSVGDLGVVNKIGSTSLVLSASRHGVPVYVVADTTKLLPPGFPQHLADDRPPEEVWPAPQGVRVWNRYFEAVPLGLVTAVVTERAALTAAELEARRADIRLPEPLLEWGGRRGRRNGGGRTG